MFLIACTKPGHRAPSMVGVYGSAHNQYDNEGMPRGELWAILMPSVGAAERPPTPAHPCMVACSGRAVPLLLLACMAPGHKACHRVEVHGSPLRIDPATEGAPLRGLLALLMRSIASPEAALNYCDLTKGDAGRCVGPSQAEQIPQGQVLHHVRLSLICWGFWVRRPRPSVGEHTMLEHLVMLSRRVWLRQSRLLALLCCGLLGAVSPIRDVLLELAAARVLTLLLDPLSWACCASGSSDAFLSLLRNHALAES